MSPSLHAAVDYTDAADPVVRRLAVLSLSPNRSAASLLERAITSGWSRERLREFLEGLTESAAADHDPKSAAFLHHLWESSLTTLDRTAWTVDAVEARTQAVWARAEQQHLLAESARAATQQALATVPTAANPPPSRPGSGSGGARVLPFRRRSR